MDTDYCSAQHDLLPVKESNIKMSSFLDECIRQWLHIVILPAVVFTEKSPMTCKIATYWLIYKHIYKYHEHTSTHTYIWHTQLILTQARLALENKLTYCTVPMRYILPHIKKQSHIETVTHRNKHTKLKSKTISIIKTHISAQSKLMFN